MGEEFEGVVETCRRFRRPRPEPLQMWIQHASGLGTMADQLAMDGTHNGRADGAELAEIVQQGGYFGNGSFQWRKPRANHVAGDLKHFDAVCEQSAGLCMMVVLAGPAARERGRDFGIKQDPVEEVAQGVGPQAGNKVDQRGERRPSGRRTLLKRQQRCGIVHFIGIQDVDGGEIGDDPCIERTAAELSLIHL